MTGMEAAPDVPGTPLLELRDVGKTFGSVVALDGISTSARARSPACWATTARASRR
jgi:simple sugar transport system ATP-binding protein